MKKLFLVTTLVLTTFFLMFSSSNVNAQTISPATTIVTKDNVAVTKTCCKSGTEKNSKSKCANAESKKCKEKCGHSGTSCVNYSDCKMAKANNVSSSTSQRSSCCNAMKNKKCKAKSTEKTE
ncbi:MAG: hypothetical protein HGB12_15930 [Bacteroidetes bacterium]|nr:hypothetical protein [Bacteroidota bacterium]